MEENKQTLYNDELLDILPDGVITVSYTHLTLPTT